MAGSQTGFTMKRQGGRPFTNSAVLDTKALSRSLMPFQSGRIVLHDLKLKAERILAHKKLHLTQLSIQLLECSSARRFFRLQNMRLRANKKDLQKVLSMGQMANH